MSHENDTQDLVILTDAYAKITVFVSYPGRTSS